MLGFVGSALFIYALIAYHRKINRASVRTLEDALTIAERLLDDPSLSVADKKQITRSIYWVNVPFLMYVVLLLAPFSGVILRMKFLQKTKTELDDNPLYKKLNDRLLLSCVLSNPLIFILANLIATISRAITSMFLLVIPMRLKSKESRSHIPPIGLYSESIENVIGSIERGRTV